MIVESGAKGIERGRKEKKGKRYRDKKEKKNKKEKKYRPPSEIEVEGE